jgi:hypothetical protein
MEPPTASVSPHPDPAPLEWGAFCDGWLTPLRFAVVLALCIVVSFPGVLLLDQSFVARDFGLFSYPVAYYMRQSFWRGEIPLWNPLHNCGIPFLAQFNTITLYPLSLIYLLLPLEWSLSFFCLVHLFLAGMGMYFLCRQWTGSPFGAAIAGMAFAFNGFSLNLLMWPSHIATYAWMPWVIWSVEQGWRLGGRWMIAAAFFGAMQMLSGGPETILLTWLILTAMWLGQLAIGRFPRASVAWRFPAIGVWVAGLAAAQLLPFLDLIAHSERDTGYSGSGWAMPVMGWANFFVPLFNCFLLRKGFYAQVAQNWTSSYYLGIGSVVLALIGAGRVRKSRGWLLILLAGSGVVLAMGSNTFIFRALRIVLPVLGFMNHPIKFVLLTVFAVPLLAGLAIANARHLNGAEAAKFTRRVVVALVASGILIAFLAGYAHFYPAKDEEWTATFWSGVSRFGMLICILGVFLLLRRVTRPSLLRLLCVALPALVWADVWTHAPTQNPTANRSVFEPGLVKLTPRPVPGVSRVLETYSAIDSINHGTSGDVQKDFLLCRQALFLNCNLLEGIPTIGGFYSLYLKRDLPIRALLGSEGIRKTDPLADFTGIAWENSPEDLFTFVPRTNSLPMITGGQRPIFASDENVLNWLEATNFNPRREVFLPLEASNSISVSNPAPLRVLAQNVAAERIDADVEARAPALLVIAQTYYHPWRAWVNDRETPIFRANYGFQAIEVPAGKSHVRLEYRDRAFTAGLGLCGFSFLIGVVMWPLTGRRKRAG